MSDMAGDHWNSLDIHKQEALQELGFDVTQVEHGTMVILFTLVGVNLLRYVWKLYVRAYYLVKAGQSDDIFEARWALPLI